MEAYDQLNLFNIPLSDGLPAASEGRRASSSAPDPRAPITVTWNGWHGCTKVSAGCLHCYMFRRDEQVGKDPRVVRRTQNYDLPVRRLRGGPHRGRYKVPAGSTIFTCFSSDFFHEAADEWRAEAWDMMRERRDCTFFMITKRPERIAEHLPADWGEGWEHVRIAVTCESRAMADRRLPVYLALPLKHKAVMVEPILGRVDLRRYLNRYPGAIESVSVGGESGPDARPCDYAWVLDLHLQCVENGVGFTFHQTGARLIRNGRLYEIPRRLQHAQAARAGLDYDGSSLLSAIPGDG